MIFTRIKVENASNVLKLQILSNFGGAYHTLKGSLLNCHAFVLYLDAVSRYVIKYFLQNLLSATTEYFRFY